MRSAVSVSRELDFLLLYFFDFPGERFFSHFQRRQDKLRI